MKSQALALLLLLISGTLHAQRQPTRQGESSRARIVVVGSDENGVTLDIAGLRASVDRSDGAPRIVHNAPLQAVYGDSLSLPGLSLMLGVPPGATDFAVSVAPTSYDTLALDGSISYRADRPAGSITVDTPLVLRGLRTVALRYQPLRYEAGRGVIAVSSARVALTWKRGRDAAKGSGEYREIPLMEEGLRSQILNYDLAKRWRTRAIPSRSGLLAASGWGMERGIVMHTGHDGIFRASGAELAATGAQGVIGASATQLRVRNHASFISFYLDDRDGNGALDAGDYVEFVGRRNPSSDGLYYDDITDTNAYILSWNGGSGQGPSLLPKDGARSAAPMAAYDSTLHFELENFYFPGISSPNPNIGDILTVHVSERVSGERYYWDRRIFPFQASLQFVCSPYYATGERVRLRMRMMGITMTNHYTDLQLNGSLIGSVMVRDTADTTIELDIPMSHLVDGRNVLTFVPTPPPGVDPANHTFPDHVFIDYLELQGRWSPSAIDNAPKLRIPASASAPVRVSLTGLAAPPTHALSGTSRIAVDSVERGFLIRLTSRQFDDVGFRQSPGFFAQFADTLMSTPLYGVGLMLIEADELSGRPIRTKFFNLYPRNDAGLAEALRFINDARDSNIIIAGLSVGTSETPFTQELKDAFARLGSTRASSPNFVAGWVFAARKGNPGSATEAYSDYRPGDPGVTLNAFFPSAGGTSYRAAVTLEGAPGEEFQIGAPETPGLHYHAEDTLLAAGNQADMIVITHPAFLAESRRLAAHRSRHDSLRVKLVDVNAIYDEFNDGVKSPVAIRRFLQYADTNWSAPAPGYVVLFGDASWDAANRLGRASNADYVPTNGVPSSDYIFTVAFGDNTMMWHQLIGRLPATTTSDARAIVDKLIEYDTLAPAAWNKRFVFMAGGSSVDEVNDHHREDLEFATGYVLSPFFEGDTAMIKRTSKELIYPDSKDAPWAREEINKGALWVSFTGHGYTDGYDLDFGYPQQLDNEDRYFVLGTFSCQTGAFAEPGVPLRNERFVMYPGKGAVAAIGGTSFSMPDVDRPMKAGFYSSITEDHDRVLGSVFTRGKYDHMFRDVAPFWRSTIPGWAARNALVMYNLLGDPAMKLAVRNGVELGFTDVRLASESGGDPLPGDSLVKISARLWNYGVPPPGQTTVTVSVVAAITDRTQRTFSDTAQAVIGRYGDVHLMLPLDKNPGEYAIRLYADPERSMREEYLADNDTTLNLRVQGNQPLPIEPVPYGRVAGYDNVVIRLLNPPSGPGGEIVVDTSAAFDSPAVISSTTTGTMQLEELTTTWTFSIPQSLRSARTFWWRATSSDPVAGKLFPLVESFTVESSAGSEYIVGGTAQMRNMRITNLVNEPAGVGPGSRGVPILVTSMGQTRYSPTDAAQIPRTYVSVQVDGLEQNDRFDNLNLLILDSGRVLAKGAFALYRGGEQYERFFAMVDSIRPGLRVLVWANGESFNDSIGLYPSYAVRQALKSLGSTKADLLRTEDSYVLIGGKGIDPSEVKEALVEAAPLRAAGVSPPYYASVTDTISAPAGSGMLITSAVGPATAWRSARFLHSGATTPRIAVYGVARGGVRDSLFSADASGTISLAGVNVDSYPRLEFRANFVADTTVRLGSILVDYDPSPELALVPSTARLDEDSVLQGDKGIANVTLVNLSRKYSADNVVVRLTSGEGGQPRIYDSLMVSHLAPLDSIRHGYAAATDKLKGVNSIRVIANPADRPAEAYQQNNTIAMSINVGLDNVSPKPSIYADGSRLMDGDYVNPQPRFEIRIYDNSALKLDDSSTVEMILDNDIIRLGFPGTSFENTGDKEYRASFFYRPDSALPNGKHEMRLAIADASGNVDTTDFIPFFVERDLKLHNVVNWPNPFVDKTTFTFLVGGARPPKSGEIAIFTVAGRRIKTIRLGAAELNIGFNRIDWDGLDEDHDRLANGVYLYRVTIDDGEAKQEIIEKLVVMR